MSMKVLFASGYNPFHAGSGPGGCLHNLSKALTDAGIEVHILTPKIDTKGDLGKKISIHYYKNPIEGKPLSQSFITFSMFSIPQIKQICTQHHIDIIHGHSPTTFAYSMHRNRSPPLVISAHGSSFGEISSVYLTPTKFINVSSIKDVTTVHPLWAYLTNLEYHYADRVISVSGAVSEELAHYYRLDREKISVIHNGVTVPPMNGVVEDYLILSIGRLVWRKGFLYLINAMPDVLKEYPKAKLVLVGEGGYKQKLVYQVKKLHLEDNVTFKGYMPKEELFNLYAKAHIYVQPSLYEPLCGTILEAMACQKPIIATNIGGNPEMIRNHQSGVLVDPYNSGQLSLAITSLLSDASYCARISKNAKEIAEKHFSWASIAKKTIEMYQRQINTQ